MTKYELREYYRNKMRIYRENNREEYNEYHRNYRKKKKVEAVDNSAGQDITV